MVLVGGYSVRRQGLNPNPVLNRGYRKGLGNIVRRPGRVLKNLRNLRICHVAMMLANCEPAVLG